MTTSADLTGRVAVVTGASSGIGAGLARSFSAAGARVALLARRADRLEALAEELGGADRALALTADVLDADALAAAASTVEERLGRPDLVVANAGVMLPGAFTAEFAGEQERMIEVNVLGLLRTLHAFLPSLRAAGADGAPADLVTVSSIAAHQRFEGYAVYSASKAAVTMLAASLRGELAPEGVRVTNVEPGLVESELRGHASTEEHREALRQWEQATPPLPTDDFADLLTHLVSRPAGVNVPQLIVQPTVQG